MRLHVRCPAKVNLFLSVGKKDLRGYHPIRTVFQAVGLCDELFIGTTDDESSLTCNWPWLGTDNTVWTALKLATEIAQVPSMEVALVKHIPAESGLGGGSSDAAGILRAVKKMAGVGSEAELLTVALAVGADVPFFLTGGRAMGEGYGQKLTPLSDAPREWLLIAKPDIGCSTSEMYAKLDALDYEWRDFPADDKLYNDFERVAPCECLELIEWVCRLGARDAGLTGSGSAVFGRFESEPLAEVACERLLEEFEGHGWVVPTLGRRESLDISVQTD
jgi:4-diphosphocytidyl-2-C-methyl-D-erythritol kinase